MSKKRKTKLVALCLLFSFLFCQTAFGITTTRRVQITEDKQVVDTMLYNSISTQAVYTPKENVTNYNSDTTYSCAALVKRFYSTVYKVTVYGLLSTTSTPVVTTGSFYEVDSPKAGDIVRFSNYTHWALVKKIDSKGNITLMEQNVWSGEYALVGRVIAASEADSGAYTFFRYSKDGSKPAVHVHSYVQKINKEHPHRYYMACSCGDKYNLDKYAVSVKCETCYDSRYGDLPEESEATPTNATVKVNGKVIKFDAYNINDNNYFKLRDIAYTINGSDKKFAVAWDPNVNAVSLTTGATYTSNGTEMTPAGEEDILAGITTTTLYLNKAKIYPLTYMINESNYVKLQDLAMAINFNVGYDEKTNSITIDTSKPY